MWSKEKRVMRRHLWCGRNNDAFPRSSTCCDHCCVLRNYYVNWDYWKRGGQPQQFLVRATSKSSSFQYYSLKCPVLQDNTIFLRIGPHLGINEILNFIKSKKKFELRTEVFEFYVPKNVHILSAFPEIPVVECRK